MFVRLTVNTMCLCLLFIQKMQPPITINESKSLDYVDLYKLENGNKFLKTTKSLKVTQLCTVSFFVSKTNFLENLYFSVDKSNSCRVICRVEHFYREFRHFFLKS